MKRATLVLPAERARTFVETLARSSNVQYEDMNGDSLKRPYRKFIQRVDELDRVIRVLYEEMGKVPIAEDPENRSMVDLVVKDHVEGFLSYDSSVYSLDEVEKEVGEVYRRLSTFQHNNQSLQERKMECIEQKWVMCLAALQYEGGHFKQRRPSDGAAGESDRLVGDDSLSFAAVAGTIMQSEQERFARTLFRATRGNTYTHFQPIGEALFDPKTGDPVQKSVFVIYFQGGATSNMREKVARICQAYSARTCDWPASYEAAAAGKADLEMQVAEKAQALQAYDRFLTDQFTALAEVPRPDGNSRIEEWRLFTLKERAIYAVLNMFEGESTLRADCWYPDTEEGSIRSTLLQCSQATGVSGMLILDPRPINTASAPTYNKPNALIDAFQSLVDTYGVARYQEVNPALFTIVTFPFIFGIMFGDIGHGLCLFLFGCWCMLNADGLKHHPMLKPFYSLRYMLALMGFFAIYAGLMYSEMVGIGVSLFDSSYSEPTLAEGQTTWTMKWSGKPYPFGLDPAWHGANNELLFVNSLKMKLAVLFGVSQMMLGLSMRFVNACYARNWVDLIFECVPMTVFMVCFFGYMDYMIMYKWVTPMDNPPSIINTMISMGLGTPNKTPLYEGQAGIEKLLMTLTMLTVPLILIPKPLILWWQHQSMAQGYEEVAVDDEEIGGLMGGGHLGEGHGKHVEAFDMGEVAIHQAIETIEYVLGTVSHTASYLRTWALSLAHQQLALVFLNKFLLPAMAVQGIMSGVAVYFGFAVWACTTAGILLGMDVLECFLHTLRLHWVEFQSKFYKADGHKFAPFSLRNVLEQTQE